MVLLKDQERPVASTPCEISFAQNTAQEDVFFKLFIRAIAIFLACCVHLKSSENLGWKKGNFPYMWNEWDRLNFR